MRVVHEPASASVAGPSAHPLPREGGRGDGGALVGSADDASTRVAIVGAGPVGLALALMLQRAGVACRVLDAQPRGAVGADRRVLALSHGTRQSLERLGVWHNLTATPIETIHVSQRGGLGRTLITARETGLPALGYVVEAGVLGSALAAACAAAGLAVAHDTRGLRAQAHAQGIALQSESPQRGAATLEAQLVAWAEGAVAEGADVVRRDYGQQAVVATVSARLPHGRLAYERFTAAGPVALLPHGACYALIAAVREAQAARLLACSESEFLVWLQEVFGPRLQFTGARSRVAFPLGLRYRRRAAGARAVWLGNAAQTLHPVAGQGFNLALRDVSQLARLLADVPDCGAPRLLARYAQSRRLDRGGVIGLTDTLVRLFSDDNPLLRHGRGAGLLFLDLLPSLRTFFARRMIFGARAWP